MQTNVQIDSKNLRGNDDNFRSRGHHITIEELVAISPDSRNWRGIFIALLVIAAVFSLILFSIYLLTPEEESPRYYGRHLVLNDILSKSLDWKPFNGTWISDNELVFRDSTGGLSILNLEDSIITSLMTNSMFRQFNSESFLVSPNRKYVLIETDRDDEGARYHVHETKTANTVPLGTNEAELQRLQYVLWAPAKQTDTQRNFTHSSLLFHSRVSERNSSSSKNDSINFNKDNIDNNEESSVSNDQAIAFVYKNDIYYKPRVQVDLVYRITRTGSNGIIYNGIPDWAYANFPELKNSYSNSLSFSPDGLYLAFMTYNDSKVSEYKYTVANGLKYPSVMVQRYPKAGTTNPHVTLSVADISNPQNFTFTQIKIPAEYINDSYISDLQWISSKALSVIVTNRSQTKAVTLICYASQFICEILHTEIPPDNGAAVLIGEKAIFSQQMTNIKQIDELGTSNNKTTTKKYLKRIFFLKRLPVRDGEHGYFRHIVFISSSNGRSVPLTMGRYEVTEILGWNEKQQIVYFISAPEMRPGERHLYKIHIRLDYNTKLNRTYINSSQPPQCLTCDDWQHENDEFQNDHVFSNESEQQDVNDDEYIKSKNATTATTTTTTSSCLYNKIHFSMDYTYYVQECLGPAVPKIYVVKTDTNSKLLTLNDGEILRNKLKQLALPQIRRFNVETRNGFLAQVRLFLPPGAHEEEEATFPLILHIDTSPGSQLVNEKFQVDWNWYLCSQRSFMVAQIDGRGSGYQGDLLRNQVHGKLGTVEIQDQLGVVTYLRDKYKIIDPLRICAYGWGYGGYATIMSLIEDSQQILQCGVAVNPIVSFGYHYSVFVERYIPLKGDFVRALQQADLTLKVGNIRGRNLMVIHGTADTIVHQEHALMLARALVDQQIKFRHQVYPDEDHFMTRSLNHVYKTMEWYFDDSFGPIEDTEWDPTSFFVFKQ